MLRSHEHYANALECVLERLADESKVSDARSWPIKFLTKLRDDLLDRYEESCRCVPYDRTLLERR